MYLPEQFLERLKTLLGDDFKQYLSSFDTTYGQTLRVNRLKTTPADFIRRFALPKHTKEAANGRFSSCLSSSEEVSRASSDFEMVPWCENGFYYGGEKRLSVHPYYYAGVYYLQEPSAMAPAQFLPVAPGDKVLDLCAAPGGKTTALAGKLAGEGVLVANDISASRCKALLKNMELAGVKNAIITCETPEKLATRFEGYFDKILVDAPCSGEGMFRKEPSMAKEWSPAKVEEYASIQKNILEQAIKMLRPGGLLLYSTCTYSPEENEQSVEYLLEQGFTVEELPWYDGIAMGMPEYTLSQERSLLNCRRFWNHRVKGEGQFAALVRKPDGMQGFKTGKTSDSQNQKKVKWPEEMRAFLSSIDGIFPESRIHFLEERVFLLPEGLPDMKGIRQIRSGLYLGDCKKKRFEPSQALAMALKSEEYHNVLSMDPDDMRVERYLKGETLDAQVEDGWVLICVDGYPLGWGKSAGGRIKNKYYKGWRKS